MGTLENMRRPGLRKKHLAQEEVRRTTKPDESKKVEKKANDTK